MAEHKTYSLIMDTFVAWGAIVVALFYTITEAQFLVVVGLVTIAFFSLAGTYFYWDYRKTHKKPEPSLTSPLPYKVAEPTKPTTSSSRKLTFVKNFVFVVIEIIEATFCLSLMLDWNVVTIPIGDSNVAVLTYQNGIIIGFFIVGIYLAIDIARRLRHPRKTFFE